VNLYALERNICQVWKNQYIVVAKCVWWLAFIIGLQQGLVIHIDHLKEQDNIAIWEVSTIPKDIGEDCRFDITSDHVYPDSIIEFQVHVRSNSESGRLHLVFKDTKKFIQQSRKGHREFTQND
jgi:hypothetical protein